MEKLHNDPALKEKRLKKLGEYYSKPDVRMSRSMRLRTLWEDESFRKKARAAIVARNKRKDIRANLSEKQKNRLQESPKLKKQMTDMLARKNTDPKHNPLVVLNPSQRKEYQRLRKCGCPKDEAIRKAKRKI